MTEPPTWLPLAVEILFFLCLLWVAFRFRRLTGETPLVLTYGDDLAGFSGRVFRAVLLATIIIVIAHAVAPQWLARTAGTIGLIDFSALAWLGVALTVVGVIVCTASQLAMGSSWRIGIPEKQTSPLVDTGMFAYSRNPIYLGIMIAIFGFVLAIPNGFMLAVAIAAFVGVSCQIRLEEQHLARQFGADFEAYRNRVRRWL